MSQLGVVIFTQWQLLPNSLLIFYGKLCVVVCEEGVVWCERMASRLAELFSQLSLSDDKMMILSQIRTVMPSSSNEDLFSVVTKLPLTGILQNINADDR
ncbi:MAG: hypothetical protein CRN43_21040 [Candidatus Nephrothrix sp. EaCA]|nr:MAG: hypothetical protein CRN43_21040 [Candidatus Nephrothrix sp. EaCA]